MSLHQLAPQAFDLIRSFQGHTGSPAEALSADNPAGLWGFGVPQQSGALTMLPIFGRWSQQT